jgi:hypothetical protein
MKTPSNKNNNFTSRGAAATVLLSLATIIIIVAGPAIIIIGINQSADAVGAVGETAPAGTLAGVTLPDRKAPTVVSGDNVYIAWWNGTAGQPDVQTDVMFRASTDGGATFSDKINLSNTTDADSSRVEIAAEGDTVVVSWWETNQTSDVPVARMSTDGGETFGAMLMLAANGTLASSEVEGEAEGGE